MPQPPMPQPARSRHTWPAHGGGPCSRPHLLAPCLPLCLALCICTGELLACGDARPPALDAAAPDLLAADLGVADAALAETGPLPACSAAIVGKACTTGGGECGADHTCLPVTATGGFCTCRCTPEDLTTPATEDRCPGPALVCAPYAPQGGAGPGYCFERLGHVEPDCISMVTHNWDTPGGFPYANMELARLTPSSAPFTVLGVRYILGGAGTGGSIPCDSTVPHRVEVWVSTEATPAASPTLAATLQAAPALQGRHVATALTLASPLQLTSGDHLFVAVEMASAVTNKAMCIVTCGVGTTGEQSFTSWTISPVNNSPPYSWSSYKALGSSQELSTVALGFGGY